MLDEHTSIKSRSCNLIARQNDVLQVRNIKVLYLRPSVPTDITSTRGSEKASVPELLASNWMHLGIAKELLSQV